MIHDRVKRQMIASFLCVMMVLSILPSASMALADTESDSAPAAVEMAGASETSEPAAPAASGESSNEDVAAPEEAQGGIAASPQDANVPALLGEGAEGAEGDDSDGGDDGDEPAAGVAHNLADYIKTLEINGNPSSVADGEKLTVKFGWLVEAGSYGASDTFTYQLPVNFEITAAATGPITQGENGPRIGSYRVDTNGLITISYNSDYNPSGQSTTNYMEITGDAKYDPNDSDNEIKFIWSNGSKVVIVTNPGDFTVTKTRYRSFANKMLSKNLDVNYTVTIASEKGTNGVFTIEDTLTLDNFGTSDSATYDASSFVLKNESGETIAVTPTINGTSFTIENVPALKAGGTYTLTYKVKLNWEGQHASPKENAHLENKVVVKCDGKSQEAEQSVTFSPVLRKTFGEYNNATKEMRWNSFITTNGTNLAGATFADTATGDLEGIAQFDSGEYKIALYGYDSDGTTRIYAYNPGNSSQRTPPPNLNVNGNTFSFTFPNVEGVSTWEVVYFTKVKGEVGQTATVDNTSTVTNPNGETWTGTDTGKGNIRGTTTVTKTAEGYGEVAADGTVPFRWHNVVEYDNVVKASGEVYRMTDKMRYAEIERWSDSGSGYNYWDKDSYPDYHYGKASELDSQLKESIRVTLQDGSVIDYAEANQLGSLRILYYSDEDQHKSHEIPADSKTDVKAFAIELSRDLQPQKVEFSYTTRFTTKRYAAGTRWRMTNEFSAEAKYATATQIYEQKVTEAGGINKQVRSGGAWSDSNYTMNYESREGKVKFRLLASPAEGETSMRVVDQLPEGFTLENVYGVQVGSYSKAKNGVDVDWTNNSAYASNIAVQYDEESNQLIVDVQNLGTELQHGDDNIVVIEYNVLVDQEFDKLDGAQVIHSDETGYYVSKAFTNTATNGDSSDSITTTVVRTQTVLEKEGAQVTENGANTSRAHYSVTINSKGLDLLEGGDELTLTDKLTSNELDFEMDRSSIKLYTADANGNKIAEVDPIELRIEQPVDDGDTRTQTFTIKVQDETAYILEYDYAADKREANSSATQGIFRNTITMEGFTSASEDTAIKGINVRVTSNFAGLQLVKVDEKNNAKFLTAEFELAKYNKDSGAYESMGTVTMNGQDGLNFDYYSANCALEGNTLYRITETKAPEGYDMDDTPFYFIIRGNIQDVRSGEIDAANLVVAEEAAAKAAAGAPEGLDIKMLMPDSGSYFEITNPKSTGAIKVEKKWIGQVGQSATIRLLANGEEVRSVVLNAENNWKHSFENMPKTDENDKVIEYTITEDGIDGYGTEITGDAASGFVVTNTDKRTTEVKVDKTWIGEPSESITIKLMNGNEVVDTKELTADDDWTYTFENLPAYDAEGGEIDYSIVEVSIEGYVGKIVESLKGQLFDVTNISTETIEIPVSKVWKDGGEESVTINLLADGKVVDTIILTADSQWNGIFSNKSKYSSEDGHEIKYAVEEVEIENYTSTVSGDAASGFVVTNEKKTTPNPPTPTTTSVKVDKQWVGGEGDSVTVKLLANGEEVESKTITANDNWTTTFTNLPKKDAAGADITYTIDEVKVDGYTTEITGDAASGYVVINEKDTPSEPTTTSVKVDKQWVGGEGDSVTVKLLANGEEVESKTITANDNWTTTFDNLPIKDAAGENITYSIEEVEVDGYNTVITGDAENGYTITNTIEGKISIGVTKEWVNRTGTSATIHLFADGVEVDSVELTRANNWQHTFTDLDQYKDGKEINYTIEEDEINRYTIDISGSAAEGFTVTNTYNPPGGGGGGGGVINTSAYVSLTASKTLDGKTPSTNEYQFTLTDSEGKVLQTKNNNGDTVTFDRLEFDKTGTYTYTVKEVAGNNANVTYDQSEYTVTIVVTGGTFNKKAEVTYTKDGVNVNSMSFENKTYPEYPVEPDDPTPDEPTTPDDSDKPTTPNEPEKPSTPTTNTPSNTTTTTTTGSKLPQTGLFWWPVGLLAAAGSTMLVASGVTSRKRDEDEEN